ncbi:Rhophilin-2 [Papilio machaon]|uniref:Rhophilin-2 n=1 Tax=Papilio machaon TaxID=76193 RepID=A0A0N1IGC4_PAPMA|nr:Rhophilin-2 [Papilio machaon]
MPMIPLGLKETKEVDFREPFKDFILEHYSEDAAAYEDAISDFMDMRQGNSLYVHTIKFTGVPSCQRTVAFEKACVLFNMAGIYTQIGAKQERTTCSGLDGAVDALLRAAGALRYIHENFTNAPSVDLAADTLLVLGTLMTAQARECLFEKLQLQAREARGEALPADLDMCLDLAQESAQLAHVYKQLYDKMQTEGVFNYVPYSWVSLVHVKTEYEMKGFNSLLGSHYDHYYLDYRDYNVEDIDPNVFDVDRNMKCTSFPGPGSRHFATFNPMKEFVHPVHNAHVDNEFDRFKTKHNKKYASEIEHVKRLNIFRQNLRYIHSNNRARRGFTLAVNHLADWAEDELSALRGRRYSGPSPLGSNNSVSEVEPIALGRAHLAEALALYEEALRLQRMCRELRGKEALSRCVTAQRERAARARGGREEPDFADIIDAPAILPASKFELALTPPDFAQHRVEDLFKSLGPIAVFSAKRHWSAPRLIQLQKNTEKRREARRDRRNGKEEDKLRRRPSDKRDHSEDNSTYYNQIRDEKILDEKRVTKQNGVYINSYNNNNYDYHHKVIEYDRYEYEMEKESKLKNGRERERKELRRVASEYNMANNKDDEGFGFTVRGDAPVVIAAVEPNSLADIGGMREGDFIISIGETDVKWSSHGEVVRLIQQAGPALTLRLATPMDTCHKPRVRGNEVGGQRGSQQGSVSGASSASSGSTATSGRTPRSHSPRSPRRAPSWNPFRRAAATLSHNHINLTHR